MPPIAVSGDADHREPGVDFVQHVPADAELLERAGSQVFDDDVRVLREPLDDLDAVGRLEVYAHRLLVARLQVPPERSALVQLSPFAKGIAAVGGFDLDDFGAEFRQHSGCERCRDEGSDLDDPNALKRSAHDACLPILCCMGVA
jgi:hypothetical protein